MLFPIILFIGMISPMNSIYQSHMSLSSMGMEFKPQNNIQLISQQTIRSKLRCAAACNQLPSCRTFDYDLVSQRCRLFEGDSTTGSIGSSSSPTSVVGTVRISSSLYTSTQNQSCQSCQQTRYEVCSTNTSTCQCPLHAYWNGSVCALQLFENDTCSQSDSCRTDLNLTCPIPDCYGVSKCTQGLSNNTMPTSMIGYGITVAGVCNGSSSTNQTVLTSQADIVLSSNGLLYVADNSYQVFVFAPNNRTGTTLRTFSSWPTFLFIDNRTSNIYMSVISLNLVYIWPSNATIPPNGISQTNCTLNGLSGPTTIVVDSVGNVYISSYVCHWVTKWVPNATSGTLVAGSPTGVFGSNSQLLDRPYGLALDEPNSVIYVADRYNYRIQKFVLGGSGVGITVAGGNGVGSAANQLNNPIELYLSKIDGSLYIADNYNNRIQKWQMNASSGITVAGSSSGISGNTPYLLYHAYAFAFDSEEKYMYVSDSLNNRVQRFLLP